MTHSFLVTWFDYLILIYSRRYFTRFAQLAENRSIIPSLTCIHLSLLKFNLLNIKTYIYIASINPIYLSKNLMVLFEPLVSKVFISILFSVWTQNSRSNKKDLNWEMKNEEYQMCNFIFH